MKEINKALQNNERVFSRLMKSEQAYLKAHWDHCKYWDHHTVWNQKRGGTFDNGVVYRIDIGYTPEPQIERCKVDDLGGVACFLWDGKNHPLSHVLNLKEWTGKVEWPNGEICSVLCRIVDGKNTNPDFVLMRPTSE